VIGTARTGLVRDDLSAAAKSPPPPPPHPPTINQKPTRWLSCALSLPGLVTYGGPSPCTLDRKLCAPRVRAMEDGGGQLSRGSVLPWPCEARDRGPPLSRRTLRIRQGAVGPPSQSRSLSVGLGLLGARILRWGCTFPPLGLSEGWSTRVLEMDQRDAAPCQRRTNESARYAPLLFEAGSFTMIT
jgi:hypothetical protein